MVAYIGKSNRFKGSIELLCYNVHQCRVKVLSVCFYQMNHYTSWVYNTQEVNR